MALVFCETSEGLRASEVTAIVTDFNDRRQFLPVDKEFLSEIGGRFYLPVLLLAIDETNDAALVQLPIEADSGDHRLWVKLSDVVQPEATLA